MPYVDDNDNDDDDDNDRDNANANANDNLREVGVPSRNILHVRGRGSKSRNRIADLHRVAAAQKVS